MDFFTYPPCANSMLMNPNMGCYNGMMGYRDYSYAARGMNLKGASIDAYSSSKTKGKSKVNDWIGAMVLAGVGIVAAAALLRKPAVAKNITKSKTTNKFIEKIKNTKVGRWFSKNKTPKEVATDKKVENVANEIKEEVQEKVQDVVEKVVPKKAHKPYDIAEDIHAGKAAKRVQRTKVETENIIKPKNIDQEIGNAKRFEDAIHAPKPIKVSPLQGSEFYNRQPVKGKVKTSSQAEWTAKQSEINKKPKPIKVQYLKGSEFYNRQPAKGKVKTSSQAQWTAKQAEISKGQQAIKVQPLQGSEFYNRQPVKGKVKTSSQAQWTAKQAEINKRP